MGRCWLQMTDRNRSGGSATSRSDSGGRVLTTPVFRVLINHIDPSPLFSVNVAFKGFRDCVSCLESMLTGRPVSVASKGFMGAWDGKGVMGEGRTREKPCAERTVK